MRSAGLRPPTSPRRHAMTKTDLSTEALLVRREIAEKGRRGCGKRCLRPPLALITGTKYRYALRPQILNRTPPTSSPATNL